jgi:hypothetical protein
MEDLKIQNLEENMENLENNDETVENLESNDETMEIDAPIEEESSREPEHLAWHETL